MKNIINKDNKYEWTQPWNIEKFNDLYNRDDRFFAVVVKGLLRWLNENIIMYNEPINHFIFNTGSSYLYIESNGYEYLIKETSGEDTMYMHLPRCVVTMENISFPTEELSSPFSRGFYERRVDNNIVGFNADIRRMPLEIGFNLHYELSNFNESIILIQELIDCIVYQKYYHITYLGQSIECSIEFPQESQININKIDLASPEKITKEIEISLTINTNYPVIDKRSEIPNDVIIEQFKYESDIYRDTINNKTDIIADKMIT